MNIGNGPYITKRRANRSPSSSSTMTQSLASRCTVPVVTPKALFARDAQITGPQSDKAPTPWTVRSTTTPSQAVGGPCFVRHQN
eukprot:1939212-Amphidinium_carterae.1